MASFIVSANLSEQSITASLLRQKAETETFSATWIFSLLLIMPILQSLSRSCSVALILKVSSGGSCLILQMSEVIIPQILLQCEQSCLSWTWQRCITRVSLRSDYAFQSKKFTFLRSFCSWCLSLRIDIVDNNQFYKLIRISFQLPSVFKVSNFETNPSQQMAVITHKLCQNQQQQGMRSVFETKTVSRKLINLQQVSIDVQTSQKVLPHSLEYKIHAQTPSNPSIAQQYDRILNETIENILISISDESEIDLGELSKIGSVDKKAISYVAALNLQFVQKLKYIVDKCAHLGTTFDNDFINSEIKYWREFILFALTETSEEVRKYGQRPTKSEVKCQNGKESAGNAIKEQPVIATNSLVVENSKQKGIVKKEIHENGKMTRSQRSKSLKGKSSIEVQCENVDN